MNGTKPHIMETVKVGDMCVFNKDNGWEIGRILQFAHHEKKKRTAYQYKGRVASIKKHGPGGFMYLVSRIQWNLPNGWKRAPYVFATL